MIALPEAGQIVRVVLPGAGGDVVRHAFILGYDARRENARVRWVDYDLPDEEIPTRWL